MIDQKQNGAFVVVVLLGIAFTNQVLQYFSSNNNIDYNSGILSRQRRLIFLTSERRLSLPPGTTLALTFTLSLPFMRNLPTGYSSGMLISVPFTVTFDALGVTSPQNTVGLGYPIYGRRKRNILGTNDVIDWSDGDRKVLYQVIEDAISNMGMDGSACLQRAICELFQVSLENHGFLGEILQLIFSASRSPNAKIRLGNYTIAEHLGKTTGECEDYRLKCPYSLFTDSSEQQQQSRGQDEDRRDKRFVYLTRDRRLTFPEGTTMLINPTFVFPIKRDLATGYSGGFLTINCPLTVTFDTVGLTSPDNSFGDFGFINEIFRKKREADGIAVPQINWAGGDREIMYHFVENYLSTFGMDGKACLLRAICDMFQNPLDHMYGVLGEALELFLSASKSPYADLRMREYIEAENIGRSTGDCYRYHESCTQSLFVSSIYQSPHTKDNDIPSRSDINNAGQRQEEFINKV